MIWRLCLTCDVWDVSKLRFRTSKSKAMFGKSQGGYTGSSVLLFCSVRSVGRRLKFSEPRMLSCWIGCVELLEMIVGGSGHHGTR